MKIQLSDHFTFRRLFRFVLPSVIMMIFTSIYGVVDGLFVSNFAGKTAFSAVNLILPYPLILGAIGFMLGSGGSAIVARTLGEGKNRQANQYFSFIITAVIVGGVLISVIGAIFVPQVAMRFGARGEMLHDCIVYGRITFISMTAYMLQNVFQNFMVTAERPKMGLIVTLCAGCTNMVLDALFVGVFRWGVAGAGIATNIAEFIGGLTPLFYFLHKNSSRLQLVRFSWQKKLLGRVALNGSSELMTNISVSLVNMFYNMQLMRLVGADGVAAYGVIMYVAMIFLSAFLGYSMGCAPLTSYNYGANNTGELQNLFKKSLMIIGCLGIGMTLAASLAAGTLSAVFVGYDADLRAMTQHAFHIYSISFLFMGFNVYGSSFFTSLENGLVSAAISFLRTLAFQIVCVLVLPVFFGLNGVWSSVVVSESLALIVTISFFVKLRKKYHYA